MNTQSTRRDSGRGRRLPLETVAEIRRRLEAGEKCVVIATDIGCSGAAVEYHKARMREGIAPREPGEGALDAQLLCGERRAARESREQRSAERQLRAYRARQAALAALREYVPGYDGVAHGATGLLWANVPRRSMG